MLRPSIFEDHVVDNMFRDFFGGNSYGTGVRSVNAMSTDIKETEDSYIIEMELPGFSKDDIHAQLKDGYLTVYAARKEEKEDKKENYIRKERYSGHYERSFYVGSQVTQEDILAKFKDGLLTMDVPKAEKKPKVETPKYIAIES